MAENKIAPVPGSKVAATTGNKVAAMAGIKVAAMAGIKVMTMVTVMEWICLRPWPQSWNKYADGYDLVE